eukprot:TRINITY_DN6250_c0_g1_i2.p1 TRINITY_DN6250_c0_g1~~TRINITY_DN6250_c0_g1_i2.p1  ORF type:complete len:179 (+),score=23.27 TRINITY_DN6250_c0_g1_i2:53-589(+)
MITSSRDEKLKATKSLILKKIRNSYIPPTEDLIGLKEQYDHIKKIFVGLIEGGGQQSELLIGPRGSGKSLVLKAVARDIKAHPEYGVDSFKLVILEGSLCSDDRVIIQSLSDQLGKPIKDYDELSKILEESTDRVVLILEDFERFTKLNQQKFLYTILAGSGSSKQAHGKKPKRKQVL